jgi:hypothetical protein
VRDFPFRAFFRRATGRPLRRFREPLRHFAAYGSGNTNAATKLILDLPTPKEQSGSRFSNPPFSLLFSWFFVRHFGTPGHHVFGVRCDRIEGKRQ